MSSASNTIRARAYSFRARVRKWSMGLLGIPVVAGFVGFIQYVLATGLTFSYKLVGIFLAFAVLSNITSKLAVKALQHV